MRKIFLNPFFIGALISIFACVTLCFIFNNAGHNRTLYIEERDADSGIKLFSYSVSLYKDKTIDINKCINVKDGEIIDAVYENFSYTLTDVEYEKFCKCFDYYNDFNNSEIKSDLFFASLIKEDLACALSLYTLDEKQEAFVFLDKIIDDMEHSGK